MRYWRAAFIFRTYSCTLLVVTSPITMLADVSVGPKAIPAAAFLQPFLNSPDWELLHHPWWLCSGLPAILLWLVRTHPDRAQARVLSRAGWRAGPPPDWDAWEMCWTLASKSAWGYAGLQVFNRARPIGRGEGVIAGSGWCGTQPPEVRF